MDLSMNVLRAPDRAEMGSDPIFYPTFSQRRRRAVAIPATSRFDPSAASGGLVARDGRTPPPPTTAGSDPDFPAAETASDRTFVRSNSRTKE
jgi:hypothetical protein